MFILDFGDRSFAVAKLAIIVRGQSSHFGVIYSLCYRRCGTAAMLDSSCQSRVESKIMRAQRQGQYAWEAFHVVSALRLYSGGGAGLKTKIIWIA